jgi:hypothetical protein
MMFQQDFEASLSAEQQVLLRYRGHAVMAKIEKVLKSSISVITLESFSDWPTGSRIKVNRVCSGRWSASNCVCPKGWKSH